MHPRRINLDKLDFDYLSEVHSAISRCKNENNFVHALKAIFQKIISEKINITGLVLVQLKDILDKHGIDIEKLTALGAITNFDSLLDFHKLLLEKVEENACYQFLLELVKEALINITHDWKQGVLANTELSARFDNEANSSISSQWNEVIIIDSLHDLFGDDLKSLTKETYMKWLNKETESEELMKLAKGSLRFFNSNAALNHLINLQIARNQHFILLKQLYAGGLPSMYVHLVVTESSLELNLTQLNDNDKKVVNDIVCSSNAKEHITNWLSGYLSKELSMKFDNVISRKLYRDFRRRAFPFDESYKIIEEQSIVDFINQIRIARQGDAVNTVRARMQNVIENDLLSGTGQAIALRTLLLSQIAKDILKKWKIGDLNIKQRLAIDTLVTCDIQQCHRNRTLRLGDYSLDSAVSLTSNNSSLFFQNAQQHKSLSCINIRPTI